jgi:hypothetical protein
LDELSSDTVYVSTADDVFPVAVNEADDPVLGAFYDLTVSWGTLDGQYHINHYYTSFLGPRLSESSLQYVLLGSGSLATVTYGGPADPVNNPYGIIPDGGTILPNSDDVFALI